jgi:hypothetical protein
VHDRAVRLLGPDSALGAEDAFFVQLPFPPLLESWERRDHPAQMRLVEYRAQLLALVGSALERLEPPLALGLHVAGRPDIAAGCDLDNFLTPVMKALGGGEAFSFVWASRGRVDERASLTLACAGEARLEAPSSHAHASARLSISPTRPEWKTALARAVGTHKSAGGSGPIDLGLRFGVSPQRNWVTLWKPAIDALGGILGEGDRPWHPRDDRICLLVLERALRPELGWDVELDVWWDEW